MFRFRMFLPAIVAMTIVHPLNAADIAHGARPFEDCLAAAVGRRAGRVIKVEFKTVDERKAYEFDIRGNDATSWDVECNADTGEIVSVELEVDSAGDPRFGSRAQISESQARDIALGEHPGTIEEIEFEVEENGAASFEFDIGAKDGTQTKIEVDAATGKITEVDHERWQVGFE